MQVKLGYLNAYEYLEWYISNYIDNKKDLEKLNKVLHDFGYCIQKTKIAEKYEEAEELKREARKLEQDFSESDEFWVEE